MLLKSFEVMLIDFVKDIFIIFKLLLLISLFTYIIKYTSYLLCKCYTLCYAPLPSREVVKHKHQRPGSDQHSTGSSTRRSSASPEYLNILQENHTKGKSLSRNLKNTRGLGQNKTGLLFFYVSRI